LCSRYKLGLVVHEPRQLAWLEAADLPAPLDVSLKLNTGMNRLGFVAEDAPQWVARLRACRNVASMTLMMHFACADEPAKGIEAQWTRFLRANEKLALPVCAANSAALFAYPQTHGTAVRPGIVLYGSSPFADRSARDLGLLATMTLQSKIIGVQDLQPGDSVGYGARFSAEQPMRIGVVACGYADGYPRHAPTGTPVWVAGQRTRLIGRVSMDMLALDLTGLNAGIGSEVELWGANLPIDEVASAAGTIAYELMCALAPRVPVQTKSGC
jgi:alanine racemase